ncbi:MAG: hypothetical protein ACI4FN_05815 [Acutalibacteraceae bacterium]
MTETVTSAICTPEKPECYPLALPLQDKAMVPQAVPQQWAKPIVKPKTVDHL